IFPDPAQVLGFRVELRHGARPQLEGAPAHVDRRVLGNQGTHGRFAEPAVGTDVVGEHVERNAAHAHSLRTMSPRRMVPACTTRALMPRRLSARPTGELTNLIASRPNRSTNLPQPVCGSAVTSMTAMPMPRRVLAGRCSPLRSRSTKS